MVRVCGWLGTGGVHPTLSLPFPELPCTLPQGTSPCRRAAVSLCTHLPCYALLPHRAVCAWVCISVFMQCSCSRFAHGVRSYHSQTTPLRCGSVVTGTLHEDLAFIIYSLDIRNEMDLVPVVATTCRSKTTTGGAHSLTLLPPAIAMIFESCNHV